MADTSMGLNRGADGHLVTESTPTNISGIIDNAVAQSASVDSDIGTISGATSVDTALGTVSAAGTAATVTQIAAVRTALTTLISNIALLRTSYSTLATTITSANTNDPIAKDINLVINGSKSVTKIDIDRALDRIKEHLYDTNSSIPGV